ncbi:MAG: NAD(+)/NADH kinase [Treponema sp.]|jgi:NAD+ kinase|nr:NAD(+)/NADH kinase [Treponema sp.]
MAEGCPGKNKSAVLFVNLHKAHAGQTADEIRRELERRSMEVTVFSFEGKPENLPQGTWDIAFSLGGDGTVLYTARSLAPAGLPIFPVNLGTLGFIAGIQKNEWLAVFEEWLRGEARVSRRCMLELSVERLGSAAASNTCLNDAVVSSSGIAKLIRLHLQSRSASGQCTGLGFYRSDGLIIATPTGSTAYSMAAGGPILDPEMEAVIINPICPFTLSNRPLVLPSRQTLVITVDTEQRSAVILTVDGQDTFALDPGDRIVIRHAPHYAMLITSGRGTYYSALRGKLNWALSGTGGGGGNA